MDLTQAVNQILLQYADECEQALIEVENDVAKQAVKKLNQLSPKNPKSHGHKGRHYNMDWYVDNKNKKHYSHIIIANRQYQLTHLLENGHDIIQGGRVVGHSKAKKHIKPVEEWAKGEVVARAELYLGRIKRENGKKLIIHDSGGKR